MYHSPKMSFFAALRSIKTLKEHLQSRPEILTRQFVKLLTLNWKIPQVREGDFDTLVTSVEY
jgi:hypothetical protein